MLVCGFAGASLLVHTGECLGYVWYDVIECLLETSRLGLVVVKIVWETGILFFVIVV